jgi:hypothetical protein
MEEWMTCYIRNECKRSAPRQIPAGAAKKSKKESAILKRFQAISSDFKPILTHSWASHPCIEHPYLGLAHARRKYCHNIG